MARTKSSPPTQEDVLSALTANDSGTLVVRGHLILEAHLNRLMDLTIHQSLTELQRLTFAQKVDLMIAVGALPADYRGAWTRLTKLRNQFAHDFRAELTSSDARDLLNSMPPTMREEIQAQRARLTAQGQAGHRTPRALAATCIGWLITFASRAVVARGGEPMASEWAFEDEATTAH